MPVPDFQTIGIAVVVLVLISEKLHAFFRYRKERDGEFEPKHKPEIWRQYAQKSHVDDSIDRLGLELKSVNSKGEESRGKLHESMREVRERVASLETSTEMINQSVVQLGNKVDRVIEHQHQHR